MDTSISEDEGRTFFRNVRNYSTNYAAYNPKRPESTTTLLLKVKAFPLQAWEGPEGSRRLRLPDFKTVGTGSW